MDARPASTVLDSPLIASLKGYFSSRGVQAYLVGGLVRDALLSKPTNDIDLAVEGDAQAIGRELAEHFNGHFVTLDATRDIVRMVIAGAHGAMSYVDIGTIHGGIMADLARRDFTVDAMALPLEDAVPGVIHQRVIDPFNGIADLRQGVIRAVSPSVFADDPARLMRAPRLAAKLGFRIEESTARRIQLDARLVSKAAPERIREELLKLLAEPRSTDSLRLLDSLGLLCEVMPELAEARGVTQPREHYWDVFGHLLETPGQVERVVQGHVEAGDSVMNAVPRFNSMSEHFAEEVADGHDRLTILKLAALLHDIAKPATRSVEPSGRIRFLGHHTEGAAMAGRILRRLRLSGRGVELIHLMVEHHLRPGQMAQRGALPSGKAVYRYYRDVGDAAVDTLYLNLADFLAARGPALRQDEWTLHCRVIGHILQEGFGRKTPKTLPGLVSGYDIIESFALSPGPKIGALLELVRDAQANGEVNTKEEALELVRSSLDLGGSVAKNS